MSWIEVATAVAGRAEVRALLVDAGRALSDAEELLAELGPVPTGMVPPDVASAVFAWWQGYEAFLAEVTSALDVRCTMGCAHCCHDDPRGVSGIELLMVLRALEVLPDGEARLQQLALRAEEMDARLARLHDDEDAAWAEYKRAYVPCPCLDDDGACTVYASRPLACRMFFSVSEPDWCDRRHPRNQEAENPNLQPAPTMRDRLWSISERLGLGGLPEDLQRGVTALRERLDR